MLVLDLQNHARDAPNPPEIEPGAPQDVQKRTKSDNKRSWSRKRRPRSAPERKITPTRALCGKVPLERLWDL